MVGDVPAEFDALVERLNEWMPDRLQDEVAPTARVVLFGFPSQGGGGGAHLGTAGPYSFSAANGQELTVTSVRSSVLRGVTLTLDRRSDHTDC